MKANHSDRLYESKSSIDSPPRETDDDEKQGELFESGFSIDSVISDEPHAFEVAIAVRLKDKTTGLSDVLTVCRVNAPIDMIEELISKAVRSKFFLRRLRAVVGDPRVEEVQGELI